MFGWNLDLGLDVGSCSTRIYQRGVGIVLDEPSAIAFSPGGQELLAVGAEAKLMADQASGDVRVVFPVRGGVVADHQAAARMVRELVRRALGRRTLFMPRFVAALTTGATPVERAALISAVQSAGARRVRLVDRPYPQPLGRRSFKEIRDRQVRWARLRRATFPIYYLPEILTGAAVPFAALAVAAPDLGLHPLTAVSTLAAFWYATELALAKVAGWHVSPWAPVAFVLRDLMLPAVWIEGLTGNGFNWRGNEMSASLSISGARHRQT